MSGKDSKKSLYMKDLLAKISGPPLLRVGKGAGRAPY